MYQYIFSTILSVKEKCSVFGSRFCAMPHPSISSFPLLSATHPDRQRYPTRDQGLLQDHSHRSRNPFQRPPVRTPLPFPPFPPPSLSPFTYPLSSSSSSWFYLFHGVHLSFQLPPSSLSSHLPRYDPEEDSIMQRVTLMTGGAI